MKNKILKNVEWGVLICTILLIAIGLVALYTATANSDHEGFNKQLMWIGIGIPLMLLATFINYEKIAKIAPIFYVIFIGLLGLVLFTERINGASSWFEIGSYTFQPSEFMKIFTILTYAVVVCKIQEKGRDEISKFWKLALSMLVVLIPMGLIVLQPDIGTATSFILILALILFGAGIKKRYIIITLILIAVAVPLAYKFVLPEYMRERIQVFLNPELDPRGAGYNIIQSKLAVGSGGMFGMGYLKGNQTQLGFLYPKTTDFIFSVVGEELGFVATARNCNCLRYTDNKNHLCS